MSKKIAEGTAALVLDVKVGSGAFMRELPAARELARTMVGLGERAGVRTSALLTSMDTPLGRAVGNAVEVEEAVATLRGEGPPDLVEVTLALAREMLALAGVDGDPAAALADGQRARPVPPMIARPGRGPGRAAAAGPAPRGAARADQDGWLRRLDARAVGVAAWRLGAGRARKEDPVEPAAGVVCLAKPGDRVTAGQPILELRADDEARFGPRDRGARRRAQVGPEPAAAEPLVIERITGG